MPTITTEAELEEIHSDPDKFTKFLHGFIDERVGETTDAAIRGAVERAMGKAKLPQRPPLSAAATREWNGPHLAGYNPDADGADLDGKFKRFGEFLQVSTPQYIARNGVDPRLKNLNESAGGDGGHTVPEEFRANLLMMALEEVIVRPRAFVLPMGSSTMKIPAIRDTSHATNVFGGVQAFWGAEAASLTASQPTFRQLDLTAKKLTGYTVASNELLADNAVGLEALLMRLFGSAIAFFEDDAFFNGTGGGNPLGILNAPALISVTKETNQPAATIVSENLDKMYSRMLPSSMNKAVWVCSHDALPSLFGMSRSVGVGGAPVFITNMAGGPPMTIYGRPLIVTEQCQTVGTVGDIFFVDFSYYLLGDRQALTMAASEHAGFITDEMTWRFVERLDGQPWVDSPLTPRHGTNTLSPFVALATRA